MTPDEVTVLPDAASWRAWLDAHEDTSDGIWLALAKKGTVSPTSLTYAQALDEALCSGWIDGQKRSGDSATFVQRFTPRRRSSVWSQRNIALVEGLTQEGRMRPRGFAEVERAKEDGRWARAYAGSATAAVPDDLAAALAASPAALALFERLSAQNRYSVLHRVMIASPTARAGRIATLVGRLANGETPHPQ